MAPRRYSGLLILLLVADLHVRTTAANKDDCEDRPDAEGCGWKFWQKAALGAAAAVGTVAAAPIVLPALGFTSAGIAAGSAAASMMSAAAGAGGGGVVAGGVVATLQSAGVAGVGAAGAAKVGVVTYAAAEAGSLAWCYLTGKDKE